MLRLAIKQMAKLILKSASAAGLLLTTNPNTGHLLCRMRRVSEHRARRQGLERAVAVPYLPSSKTVESLQAERYWTKVVSQWDRCHLSRRKRPGLLPAS